MERKRYSGVIVKYKDKVLLCKRNKSGSFPGMWSIPAGHIEPNEESKSAAKREFYEETSVDIDNEVLDFIGILPRFTRDGRKCKGLMYVYLLKTDDIIEPNFEDAIDGDEHSDWGYFSKPQLKKLNIGKHLEHLLNLFLRIK